jgi:hypothetical protein
MKPLPLNTTALRLCTWGGPAFVVLEFLAMVPLAGFIPPPAPSDSAELIASWYQQHTTAIQIGILVWVIGTAFNATFGSAIAVWTRRSEAMPVLTYVQLVCVSFVLVDAFFTGMVWGVAAFRPDEVAADTTRMLNDLGWFLFLFTWPPFTLWLAAIGLGIILDKSEHPAFPRWVAYYSFWVGLLMVPAGLMIFVKRGPFGFNGLIAFWLPVAAFFPWVCVMTYMVLRAISAEEQRQALPAPSVDPQAVGG